MRIELFEDGTGLIHFNHSMTSPEYQVSLQIIQISFGHYIPELLTSYATSLTAEIVGVSF
jgi:hypothetical protein